MEKRRRAVWKEINLDHLAHNCREIKKLVKPETLIMAVVKADGEGHGAVEIGKTLLENGIDRFAVATLSEAIQLRMAYEEVPILVLGYTPEYKGEEVIDYNITQTIYSYEQARAFSNIAKEMGKEVKLHIKIDTGMHRIGMKVEEKTIAEIQKIWGLPNVFVEGIFTHFAVADQVDKTFTHEQIKQFQYICDRLKESGIEIPIKHVSNSAAIMDLPELNFDMVRPGRILYGYTNPDEEEKNGVQLKKVMAMKAEICDVREIEEGEGISYGLAYKAAKTMKIATLPFGYGDGFTGLGKSEVLVQGKRVPVVGRITMDMCMVDVTGLDVNRGEEVILFGSNGKSAIWLEENAQAVGILSIGILFWSSPRVPREYYNNGEMIYISDDLLKI